MVTQEYQAIMDRYYAEGAAWVFRQLEDLDARRAAQIEDLLVACKAVLEAHDANDWSEPGISDAFYSAIDQMRAAMARATGGQP